MLTLAASDDVFLFCTKNRLKINIAQKIVIKRRNRHCLPVADFLSHAIARFAATATCGSVPLKTKGTKVKLIIATIKPFKLEEVREALTDIGVRGMMVTEIKGFGSQSGHTEIYRGAEYAVNFVPKVKLEIVVNDAMADQVVETITTTAKTGKIGDGKIFVLDVSQAVRVRTGETNEDAV